MQDRLVVQAIHRARERLTKNVRNECLSSPLHGPHFPFPFLPFFPSPSPSRYFSLYTQLSPKSLAPWAIASR